MRKRMISNTMHTTHTNMLTTKCVSGLLISSFILTLWVCPSEAAATRVETTLPIPAAEEHGVFSIHCQVWNLASDHEVTMFRRVGSGIQRLSLGEGISEGVSERVFLAVRQLVDGSKIYFLTFMEATRADRGEYSCKVVDIAAIQLNLPSDSVTVEIEYFPSDFEPVCASSTRQVVVQAGHHLVLNCSSQVGNPPVNVQWMRAGTDEILRSTRHIRGGMVFALLQLRPSERDDQAVFICKISSEYFPEEVKTCHIGPFTVVGGSEPGHEEGNVSPNIPPSEETVIHRNNKSTIGTAERCKNMCENTDVFYWVLTTTIAGFIAVLFLTISLILLVKFHSARSNADAAATEPQYMQGLRPQPREEIYTELEGRIGPDNLVFMKLEKQAPTNQLIMPMMGSMQR